MSGITDTFSTDYVLSASDCLTYGEDAMREEESLNWETRAMLESICASVEPIIQEMPQDIADSLADLDEVFERHGI